LLRQLQAFKHGVRGTSELDVNGKQMAPMAQTLVDDNAMKNVVAYIASLPEVRPAPTVFGDPARGKAKYENCVSCHGAAGQGIWATKAPRLSNMSDWYLKHQLQNFKDDIRGVHAQDFYGSQMRSMAKPLADPNAINDLVDYLHTM
jgi:cytochrome c oxidase subunit 2